VTDSVTNRHETPLLLAATKVYLWSGSEREIWYNPEAGSETVKTLVIQGHNDPMDADDVGYTSLLAAAANQADTSLRWLLCQDEYELNLEYSPPTGQTAAAYVATRDDISPALLSPLLRSGFAINGPCAKRWLFRYRSLGNVRLEGTF